MQVMVRDGSRPPVLLQLRSSKRLIAFTIFIATFTDGFVYGVIVPVLPFSLVERSGVADSQVQFWCSTLLAVHGGSMLISSPVAGWVADRSSSRRLPFLAGLALIFLSTILFMVGRSPALLVVARCLQGCSAGIVFTVGLALLVDTVGREEVGQWLGLVLSGMSTGMIVAPFIGGIIYAKAGYYAVFATVLAVVAFDFFLRTLMIEKRSAYAWMKALPATEATSYGALSQGRTVPPHPDQKPRLDELSDMSTHSDDDSIGSCTGEEHITSSSEGSHCKDVRMENSFLARCFPTMAALVGSPRLMAAVYGSFVNTTLTCAFDGVLPIFVKHTFGWGAVGAGVIFLPISLPSLLGPLVGMLSDSYGPRIVVLGGFCLATPALTLLALVDDSSLGQAILLCSLLVLVGIGSAAIYAPLAADMSVVVGQIADDQAGTVGEAGAYARAYGLFDGAVAAGTVIGPALAGLLYETTNWAIAVGTLAVICISGAVPVICYTGSQNSRKPGYEPITCTDEV